jgi:hypothetical protein
MSHNDVLQTRWEGWAPAMRHLATCPGTLWIISPFITTTPPADLIQGARVLTTLDPVHFARGASKVSALADLLQGGAEVRILPRLHAKVYLRMHASQAVGFSGSANLTQKGERHNHEIMTGPEVFSIPFIRDLTGHWSSAPRLTLDQLAEAEAQAARLRENLLTREQLETDVVVIIIDTQMLRGSFELTESKVGIPAPQRTPGLRPARVDFVKARDRKRGVERLKAGLKQLQGGPSGHAVSLGGMSFAVPIADRDRFQDGIEALHHDLRAEMKRLADQHAAEWKEDFLGRLRQAAQRYVKADPERIELVLSDAGSRFDLYLSRLDVGLNYGTYLPLQTPSRPLAHDFRTYFRGVRENQVLGWGAQLTE